MDSYTLLGSLVLPDRIVPDGVLEVENGVIKYAGRACGTSVPHGARRVDGLIAPGFVDIHCHAGGKFYCHDNPRAVAAHHLAHGTTSMLFTMYRRIPIADMLKHTLEIKALLPELRNVLGVHLEGPYLNPDYGSGIGVETPVREEEYMPLCETGIVRQWTCAPEMSGTEKFIRDITSHGIVSSIGHSCASPEDVALAADAGATLVTHLFDATGNAISPTRYGGTLEVSFDSAVLAHDGFFYEIICDKNGVHVRPDMVKLAIKAAGIDRIVGITDCCTGSEDDSDVNFFGGELVGSKMTMDKAARNFYALGLSVPDVFRVCSLNPAGAIHADGEIGSLEAGKRADVIVVDGELNLLEVLKA